MLLFSCVSLVKVQIVWLIEKRELHFLGTEGVDSDQLQLNSLLAFFLGGGGGGVGAGIF
jgi:hypothetical protein